MQTVSVVLQLSKGDTVNVYRPNPVRLMDYYDDKKTQFIGWLLKSSEPGIIFDGVSNHNYKTSGTITYSSAYENVGNGLNVANGVFTAPTSGIYYFHFEGLPDFGDANLINLKLNGEIIASSFRHVQQAFINHIYSGTGTGLQTISAIRRLAKGDKVNVFNSYGKLRDNQTHRYTQFIGWLLMKE